MTINEIAKLAGVSRATVSRYLNEGYVSEEKKERIRKVIEKTGYQPSSQAQMLRTRKTKLIGVIIPRINSHTISRMVGGIGRVLSRQGYQMILSDTENDEQEELKYLKLFRENHVDGVILIATIFTKNHRKVLEDYQVPVVVLGQQLQGFSCVYQDDFNAAKELAERMLKSCRCLCFAGVTNQDKAAGKARQDGYEAALSEKGISFDESRIQEAAFRMESGKEAAKRLLERLPEMDGLMCATDEIAIGAITYLKRAGKRVPEDVRVCGFGDNPMGQVVEPNLMTVHYYYQTSGEEAARMLVDLLEAEDTVSREVKMGFEVIERGSGVLISDKKRDN